MPGEQADSGSGGFNPVAAYAAMWRKNYSESQPFTSAVASLSREAIKDVRATMNEVFFSHGEHAPEPGTPLNPTPQIITQEMTREDIDLD